MKNANTRRHFAIRAAIAKRNAENAPEQTSVMFFGRQIPVTEDNANLVEFALTADAQAAYAAACAEADRKAA